MGPIRSSERSQTAPDLHHATEIERPLLIAIGGGLFRLKRILHLTMRQTVEFLAVMRSNRAHRGGR